MLAVMTVVIVVIIIIAGVNLHHTSGKIESIAGAGNMAHGFAVMFTRLSHLFPGFAGLFAGFLSRMMINRNIFVIDISRAERHMDRLHRNRSRQPCGHIETYRLISRSDRKESLGIGIQGP